MSRYSSPSLLSLALTLLVSAAAGGPARAAVPAPAGAPAGYMFTHHGWFHASCVLRVGEGESVGSDLVIRGPSGNARAVIRPCAYPRYDRAGRALSTGGGASAAARVEAAPLPAAALYDGYIVYYDYTGNLAVGPALTTDWTVPLPPTRVGNQDIAFFNDIVTSADGGDILQPVLDFNGETGGKWSIESEHCCINGNDMQTTPIVVAPGDTIRGIVTGASCTAAGCQSWTVTTTDVTSGKSTTLNTTAPGGVPNGASPGSLETYGVTSCDMFPASGQTTFTGNTLTANGTVQSPKYNLYTLQGVDAEVPRNCGYGGTVSSGNYTLIYGMVPDGGVMDAGGPRDAASDGRADSGGSGAGGSGVGGSGNDASVGGQGGGGRGGRGGAGGAAAGASGAAGAAGGASGRGGASGAGGSTGASGRGAGGAAGTTGAAGTSGTAGATGTAGTTGASGGSGTAGSGGRASVDAGASGAGGSAAGSSGSAGGCGCEAAPGRSAPAAWAFLILALMLARPASRPGRSRRRR